MELKKREEIVKMLECWTSEYGCKDCPFIDQGCFDCGHIPIEISKSILALIKELTADVERVSKQCGEIIVECDERDAERLRQVGEYAAKIKELTEEIKDLEAEYDRVYEQAEADIRGNMADGGTSCHWCMDKTKADTVKRMREMLNQRIDRTLDVFDFNVSECNAVRQVLRGVKDDIYQVAKEFTED